MEAIQIQQPYQKKSLDCSCERITLNKSGKIKFCNYCEICSEKKFLRQISNPSCCLNDPFSDIQ